MARSFLLIIFLLQLLFSRFGCFPVSATAPCFGPSGTGLLLGDTVNVAAAEGHLTGLHAHHLTVREHLLYLTHRQRIVLVAVLGRITPPLTMRKFI